MSADALDTLVVVTADGRRVIPALRQARMIRLILATAGQLEAIRTGTLRLHFNGNSVSHAIEERHGPEWLEKAG